MPHPEPIRRAVSFGGGVQSTALLVMAARGDIDYRTFLFANVGDDSEHPDSLRYVREVAMPYAAAHDIDIVELHKRPTRGRFAGQTDTLWKRLMDPASRSLPIPVRMSGSGAPGNRSCTSSYKIDLVGKWLREHGATVEAPATVALGISVDEIQRARPGTDPRSPYQARTYPLLDAGLNRRDCMALIADEGLEVPPKSSCFFCPFHDKEAWQRLKRETPDLFDRSVLLEDTLNARRETLGRDRVYLTSAGRRLADVFVDDQLTLDLSGSDCDSGYCFT